jgi:hypothetical protein
MPEHLHEIGRVKQVQVQRSSLKVGEPSHVYYDPSPLLVVARLQVTPHGAIGVTAAGEEVMDIHHVHHPHTKNARGKRDLSIGFTSHYAAMRDRFGEWFRQGCAGENILVETQRPYTLADLREGLAIESQHTGEILYLGSLKVAAPCVEFSQYAANFGMTMPPQELKETLQFLNDGQRGFYVKLAATHMQGGIEAGDRVYSVSNCA